MPEKQTTTKPAAKTGSTTTKNAAGAKKPSTSTAASKKPEMPKADSAPALTIHQTPTISASAIYGFDKAVERARDTGKVLLEDHPEFPNPRTVRGEISQDVIDAVAEDGRILTPIVIMQYGPDIVVLDGKTRLMGLVKAASEDGKDVNLEVPYTLSTPESAHHAKVEMVALNIFRENLPDNVLPQVLQLMRHTYKMTDQDLAGLLRRPGRNGVRYVRQLLEVATSPSLTEAIQSGDIPTEVATQIATRTTSEKDRKDLVKKTVERAKALQKKDPSMPKEKAARKAAKETGAARVNWVALDLPELKTRATAALSDIMSAVRRNKKLGDTEFVRAEGWNLYISTLGKELEGEELRAVEEFHERFFESARLSALSAVFQTFMVCMRRATIQVNDQEWQGDLRGALQSYFENIGTMKPADVLLAAQDKEEATA